MRDSQYFINKVNVVFRPGHMHVYRYDNKIIWA